MQFSIFKKSLEKLRIRYEKSENPLSMFLFGDQESRYEMNNGLVDSMGNKLMTLVSLLPGDDATDAIVSSVQRAVADNQGDHPVMVAAFLTPEDLRGKTSSEMQLILVKELGSTLDRGLEFAKKVNLAARGGNGGVIANRFVDLDPEKFDSLGTTGWLGDLATESGGFRVTTPFALFSGAMQAIGLDNDAALGKKMSEVGLLPPYAAREISRRAVEAQDGILPRFFAGATMNRALPAKAAVGGHLATESFDAEAALKTPRLSKLRVSMSGLDNVVVALNDDLSKLIGKYDPEKFSSFLRGKIGKNTLAANNANRLLPRVDVSDAFVARKFKDGSIQYAYGDPDGMHGLVINIDKQGILGFNIRAEGDVATHGSGRDMFISAMRRIEADGVKVNAIRGYWMKGTDSINFAQYTRNLSSMSPQQAAINTWTGRIASDFGYTVASQPKTVFGNTTVIFTKPGP